MINIIFMGTPDYAEQILKTLCNESGINVVAVYTQPDKKVGRKQVLTPPPVKSLALEHNIAVFQPRTLKDEAVQSELCGIACDYIIVAAYGQILPKVILDYKPCINLHASILPQYRGASPIQQSLLNNDSKTGVSAMLMDEGLDTGAVLKITTLAIDPDECADSLFKRLTDAAAELTVEVLYGFNNLHTLPQDNTMATHCKKISKSNGLVTFHSATELYNKYRAYTPWPGIFLESGLKLKKIRLLESTQQHKSGEIIAIDKESISVGCNEGSLQIFLVQPPSKKEMSAVDYVNGKRWGVGNSLA